MASAWIDISVPIYTGMVHWPGDPSVVVDRTKDVGHGDPATLSLLSINYPYRDPRGPSTALHSGRPER